MRRGFLRTLLRNRIVRIALVLLVMAGIILPLAAQSTARKRETAPSPAPVQVVSALVTIPPRTVITSSMVELKTVPPELAQRLPPDALHDVNEAVNCVANEFIPMGAAVSRSQLMGRLSDIGIAVLIPPGKRAMLLLLRHNPQIVNLLHPGDHIDVIATFENEFSRMVATDVEVLSVNAAAPITPAPHGMDAAPTSNTPNSPATPPESLITVAVTPSQAEVLALCGATTLDVTLHPKGSLDAWHGSEGILKREVARKWVRDKSRPAEVPRAVRLPPPPVTFSPPSPAIHISPVVSPVLPSPPAYSVEVIAGGQRKMVEVPQKSQ